MAAAQYMASRTIRSKPGVKLVTSNTRAEIMVDVPATGNAAARRAHEKRRT
jgi:hypothetical protein